MTTLHSVQTDQFDPEDLHYLLWWTQDGEVWAVVLTFLVGLTGALVGGWFSARAARKARKYQIEDLKRAAADADARDLHSKFVDLMSRIDQNPEDLGQMIGVVSWYPEWKAIWTSQLRTDLRVGADVIPNEWVRSDLQDLIGYLNNARDLSTDGLWPGRPNRNLRRLVGMLAAEGVDIMSSYRRGDEHVSRRKDLLDGLRANTKEYKEWEAQSEAASERAAEAWWQGLSEKQKQKAKKNEEKVVAALRAGSQRKRSTPEPKGESTAADADSNRASDERQEDAK